MLRDLRLPDFRDFAVEVEIVRGIATSAETYDTAVGFAESLGKTTTNAEDFPAFIVVDDKGNDFYADVRAAASMPVSLS